MLSLCVAGAALADIRTKPIRLVHEVTWDAAPTTITVTGENLSDHEASAEFFRYMNEWIVDAFGRLDYTVQDDADVHFHWTLDVYDPGSAAKRWTIGFGAGKSYVQGTVTIERAGEVVGRYTFSARPKGIKPKGLAKEVGPILVLKIHQGGSDEELHEFDGAAEAGAEDGAD